MPKSKKERVDPKKALRERASERSRGSHVQPTAQPQHDADALIDKAETMQIVNPTLALQFIDRALEQNADYTRGLELKAIILHSLERVDEAKALFERCCELEPDHSWSKYLFLGQMCSGEEAAQHLSQGISLMADYEALISEKQGMEEEIMSIHLDISSAFCALAEVYLTDLCDVEEAQETCLALMQKALDYDETNVEALQTLASIHISMSEPEKALEYLLQSVRQWHVASDGNAAQEEGAEPSAMDTRDEGEESELPPYEFRINTCKLLLELEQFTLAIDIAEQLLSEDENIMQVWYVYGWGLYLQESFTEAKASLEKATAVYNANNCERPEVLDHINELLAEIEGKSQ